MNQGSLFVSFVSKFSVSPLGNPLLSKLSIIISPCINVVYGWISSSLPIKVIGNLLITVSTAPESQYLTIANLLCLFRYRDLTCSPPPPSCWIQKEVLELLRPLLAGHSQLRSCYSSLNHHGRMLSLLLCIQVGRCQEQALHFLQNRFQYRILLVSFPCML